MSSPELQIAVEQARGRVPVTIMRIEGSVDAANYQALQTAVDRPTRPARGMCCSTSPT